MAEYQTTGSLRIAGMGYSGVEWDGMVDKLFKVERVRFDRLEKWKSDWNLRKEGFEKLKTDLISLQKDLQKINSPSKFLVKSSVSSTPGVGSAKVEPNAAKGTYNLEVGRIATNATWSKETGIADKFASINETGQVAKFEFTFKDKDYSLNIPPGTSLEGIKTLINNDLEAGQILKASVVNGGSGYILQIDTKETGTAADLTITNTTGLDGLNLKQDAWITNPNTPNVSLLNLSFSSLNEIITSTPTTFSWVEDTNGTSVTYSVNLQAGATLNDLQNAVNANKSAIPISLATAAIVPSGNGFLFGLVMPIGSTVSPSPANQLKGFGADAPAWNSRQGQNAQYRVNGWPSEPNWYESASNELKDIDVGISFTLRSEGKTTITIDTDTAKIVENVKAFVEAINKVRTTLQELTKVEEKKEVILPDYAESQFETQKGSVLTGNYGVQIIETQLKQIIASSGLGFLAPATPGAANQDFFNALSQIGIVTDTKEASADYGMLVIRSEKDAVDKTILGVGTIEGALKENAEAVALLFSATTQDAKVRNIPGFEFAKRSVATKNGTYKVDYTIDASGQKVVKIDGLDAVYDSASKTYSLPSTSTSGAVGLDLRIKETEEGSYSGNIIVSGKEGEVGYPGKIGENTYSVSSALFSFSGAAPQTQPGTYDVRYEVDNNGNIVSATINGKKAKYEDGVLKMADLSESDPANGIELVIGNLAEGTHVGQISIRQGKVNELLNTLSGNSYTGSAGYLSAKTGTLSILIDNYSDIMKGATKSMELEADRLSRWRDNMIKKFSRLESVLAKYERINSSLESQVKQLSGGK